MCFLDERGGIAYIRAEPHLSMGMRKKLRTKWKEDRKTNLADQRRAKAIRFVKAAAKAAAATATK